MNSQTKKLLTIVSVFALALVLFTGTALAGPVTPSDNENGNTNQDRLSQMIEWMGPENWGQMIQRMNQIHGPEFTGRMIPQTNQSGFCHNGDHPGLGSVIGRGFGGMIDRGFGNQMGSGLQNDDLDNNGGVQVGSGFRGGMMNRGFGR